MVGKERTKLDFGDELDNLDFANFEAEPEIATPSVEEKKQVKAVAQAAGFKSREPKTARPQRRRRTGRNAQLNIKVTPETMEAFYAIADKQGWVLGEAMEKAVELLEKEYR